MQLAAVSPLRGRPCGASVFCFSRSSSLLQFIAFPAPVHCFSLLLFPLQFIASAYCFSRSSSLLQFIAFPASVHCLWDKPEYTGVSCPTWPWHIGRRFEPYRRRPCGVTLYSSRTVAVIKLRRTAAFFVLQPRRPCGAAREAAPEPSRLIKPTDAFWRRLRRRPPRSGGHCAARACSSAGVAPGRSRVNSN